MIKKCSRDNTHVLMCRYYIDIHHTHAWINFGFAMVVVVLLLSVDDDGWAYSNSQWLRLLLLAIVDFASCSSLFTIFEELIFERRKGAHACNPLDPRTPSLDRHFFRHSFDWCSTTLLLIYLRPGDEP